MFRSSRALGAALCAFAGPLAGAALAQCELGPLTPSAGDALDRFGSAVALSGTTAVVGAPGDSGLAYYAGSVVVYDWDGSTWTETVELTASDPLPLAFFGSAVAIDADTIVVGAPNADNPGPFAQGPGAAYVFERNLGIWTETAKLTASDAADRDFFGGAVDVDGSTIAVGADNHGSSGLVFGTGAAYLFEDPGTGWVETQLFLASDGVPEDGFGGSLALSGNTLLIGAVQLFAGPFSTASPRPGAVYSFVDPGGGWAETQRFEAALPVIGDEFGAALALDVDRALIGAPALDLTQLPAPGAAHLFDRIGGVWSVTTALAASDATAGDGYGSSVALDGTRGLVAAPRAVNAGGFPLFEGFGAVYVVEDPGGGWAESARLITTNLALTESFAEAVALDADLGLTTSLGDVTPGAYTGTAHAWSIGELACPSFLALPASISVAAGGTQVLSLRADPALAGNLVLVLGSASGTSPGLPAGAFTMPLNVDSYFFYTLRTTGIPPLSGQFGVLPADGVKRVLFTLPPGLSGSLAGLTFNHAWVVFDLALITLAVSDPAPVLITP